MQAKYIRITTNVDRASTAQAKLESTDDCINRDIELKINNACKRLRSLKELMKDKNMPIKEKKS